MIQSSIEQRKTASITLLDSFNLEHAPIPDVITLTPSSFCSGQYRVEAGTFKIYRKRKPRVNVLCFSFSIYLHNSWFVCLSYFLSMKDFLSVWLDRRQQYYSDQIDWCSAFLGEQSRGLCWWRPLWDDCFFFPTRCSKLLEQASEERRVSGVWGFHRGNSPWGFQDGVLGQKAPPWSSQMVQRLSNSLGPSWRKIGTAPWSYDTTPLFRPHPHFLLPPLRL